MYTLVLSVKGREFFCAISPAGGQRASMNGHLRDRWKQAVQKLIAQYREYDKKPKERKGK